MRRRGLDSVANEGGDTESESGGHVTRTVNRQQAMNSLDMEEWWKDRRIKKCKRARPEDKLVVGARMLFKQNMKEDGEVERYKYRLVTYGF